MDSANNEEEERKQPARKEIEEEEGRKEQARPTQEELDAQNKRRIAAGRATAPASAPGAVASRDAAPTKGRPSPGVSSSTAAQVSRQAVELNVNDTLAKRRAAAGRSGPATRPGVVPARPDPAPPAATSYDAQVPPSVALRTNRGVTSSQEEPYSSPVAAVSTAPVAVASANNASAPPVASDHMVAAAAAAFPSGEDLSDYEKATEEAQNKDGPDSADPEAALEIVSAQVETPEEAPVVHPYVDAVIPSDVVDAGIEAFVADTVVDATGVAVVMSEEEEEKFEQSRRKKYLCYGGIVLVIVAVSIVVPVVLLVGGNTVPVTIGPTIAPTGMPSVAPSEAPTTDSFSTLLRILEGLPVTEEGVFDNRNAPQYEAALWLADEDKLFNSALAPDDPKALQRYALATLYYSTNGDNWKLCGRNSPSCGETSWLTEGDECGWFAVSCDEGGVVTQINFPATGNDLIGTMPPELSLFTGLKLFLAPENSLRGDLDLAFGGLSTLQTVAVPDNRLSGTIPVGILEKNPDLAFLDLGGNQFKGTLPTALAAAVKLSDLQLNGNKLTGTIPPNIGDLSSLLKFEVQGNNLVGTVPDELFSLTKLQTMSIRENQGINGTINPLISKLTGLKILQLGITGLGGTIPSEMFVLTDLTEMNLEGAQFSGTIPEDFKLLNASLMDLFLNNNKFTGSVPAAFDHLTALETLQIQGNELTGSISAAVCSERGLRFQQLATLIVDCVVACECCDNCEE